MTNLIVNPTYEELQKMSGFLFGVRRTAEPDLQEKSDCFGSAKRETLAMTNWRADAKKFAMM